jgi:signal peptidase II
MVVNRVFNKEKGYGSLSFFFISMGIITVIDQVSKWLVISRFYPGGSRVLIDGFLYLTYVQNRGAAFGILQGKGLVFIVISSLIVGGIIIYNIRYPISFFTRLVMGIIAGGALGNLIDRWQYNYVVDFLDLGWWPVFNIADIAIVCGGIVLAWHLLVLDG